MEETNLCGKCNKPKKLQKPYEELLVEGEAKGLYCNCGRPTLYSEQMLQSTKDYIANCNDIAEDKENGIKKVVNLPTIEGLAYEIKVNKTTIYEWCKVHEEFSNVIDDLLAKQAKSLINNGLSGDYSQVISKVLLTKHGYIDKQDLTSDGKAIKGNSIIFSDFKNEE